MISIYKYGEVPAEEIFARVEPTINVEQIVTDILADVRKRGDEALFEYCEKLDHAKLTALEVTPDEIEEALSLVVRLRPISVRSMKNRSVTASLSMTKRES